jgi:hypothetical protein
VRVKEVLTEYARGGLQAVFEACASGRLEEATEVRIRQNLPLSVRSGGKDFFLSARGVCLDMPQRLICLLPAIFRPL